MTLEEVETALKSRTPIGWEGYIWRVESTGCKAFNKPPIRLRGLGTNPNSVHHSEVTELEDAVLQDITIHDAREPALGFKKHDSGKPSMHLLPHEALVGAAQAMTYGAKKYDAHNWRRATTWNRYYDATLRHLIAWQMGEDIDPDSGAPHLDHAVCSLLMLSSLEKTGVGEDDRYKPASTERKTT